MPASMVRRIQRLIVRTERGWLRPLWRWAFELAIRALSLYLRRGVASSAYASGSFGAGEPVYGVADVDLVLVADGDPTRPGGVRSLLIARWNRLRRLIPLLDEVFDVAIYETAELARAVSAPALTYGLKGEGRDRAMYLGSRPLRPPGLAEGPGLYGPTAGWRRAAGPDRLPQVRPYDAQERRLAVWLSLQSWWRFAFGACTRPEGPRSPGICVKFVAEPVRCWLWLVHGERHFTRRSALERALVAMPEEEPALRAALALEESLAEAAEAPLERFLPVLNRLTSRVAARLADEVAEAGDTEVRLRWENPAELVLDDGSSPPEQRRLLPLADWRALVFSWLADETLSPAAVDPRDPRGLAEAAQAGRSGPYPALRHEHLLVLPTAAVSTGRGRLRAVQCRLTDPVSWSLLDGRSVARFPNVAGWSARHTARRAVAEHRAWLEDETWLGEPPLARPLSAARAAMFLESIEAGAPELSLTLADAARRLDERVGESVAQDALAAYRRMRGEPGWRPDPHIAGRLRETVRDLPAFSPSSLSSPVG
jgi:hypothetical protein